MLALGLPSCPSRAGCIPIAGFKLASLSRSCSFQRAWHGLLRQSEDGNRSSFWLPDLGGVLPAVPEPLIIHCPLSAQTPLSCVPQSAWPRSPWLIGTSSFPLSWEGASSPPLAEQREHGRPHCSVSPWPRATPSLSSAWMPPMSCFSRAPKVRGDLRGQWGYVLSPTTTRSFSRPGCEGSSVQLPPRVEAMQRACRLSFALAQSLSQYTPD